MTKHFLVLLVVICTTQSCVNNKIYYGHVCDYDKKTAIEGVKVSGVPTYGVTYTDGKGYFLIKKDKDIASDLIFMKEGYRTDTIPSVYTQHGESLCYNFRGDTVFLTKLK